MFFCQPPKSTMAQYFSQPFPKPGRNVFTLLCILFVCPPLQPRGPPRSRERQRLLDPCIGDGEVGVGAVRHGPVEVEGREVAVLVQVDRGLHRQHDVPGGKDACVLACARALVEIDQTSLRSGSRSRSFGTSVTNMQNCQVFSIVSLFMPPI